MKKLLILAVASLLLYACSSKPPVEEKQDNSKTEQDAAQAAPVATVDELLSKETGLVTTVQGQRKGIEYQACGAMQIRGCRAPGFDDFNTEEYSHITENGFLAVTDHPLSTFSIDVDAASYSNVRRFITESQQPPVDAVRIEELINYFTYDYPQPTGDHPFSVITEISDCPWNTNNRLLHIGLQGKSFESEELPASNLVFLLDVSGSMNSPDKLGLVKKAFRMLTDNLREQDRVAIVVYAGAAGLVLPSTSGDNKQEILAAIEKLHAGGSTAGGAGIRLAYEVASKNLIKGGNNRVILATDGDFNVGISNTSDMVRLMEEKRELGISITVLGFGMGNLKDSRMEQMADNGNGNYYYIDNEKEAKKVFVNEMGSTLFTIAKDVKIQIEFNPVRVASYRLIGYENRLLNDEDFNDDKKDAGEIGAGHTVTALYEIVPAGGETGQASIDPLKYQTTGITNTAVDSDELLTLKLRYKQPDGDVSRLISVPVIDEHLAINKTSNNFRFSAAVAEFGMLLRGSEFSGDATFADVIDLAGGARGRDKFEYRSEFIDLVKRCKDMGFEVAQKN
ncbi:MAG: VWA domain-containing protein [Candidatus Zixiibacteriota bacterium]